MAQTWPEIHIEKQFVVELVRRGQRGRAEQGLVALEIGGGGDVHGFAVAFRGRRLKAEEVQGQVHRRKEQVGSPS